MIISAKLIRNPRKPRHCESCHQQIDGPILRLYGYACDGDPPYVIYLHPKRPCVGDPIDPKIKKVFTFQP